MRYRTVSEKEPSALKFVESVSLKPTTRGGSKRSGSSQQRSSRKEAVSVISPTCHGERGRVARRDLEVAEEIK